MGNQEQLDLLKQGVERWNRWRRRNPGLSPNLIGANLSYAHLQGADLRRAYLSGADLRHAHLSYAYLNDANLAL